MNITIQEIIEPIEIGVENYAETIVITVAEVRGIQGIQGEKGDTGAQGVQGIKGDTGFQGEQGIKGDTGLQGDQGIKGDTGAQGIQGIKGDTGAQGVQGIKGDTGIQGEKGIATKADVETLLTGEINTHSHPDNGSDTWISTNGSNLIDHLSDAVSHITGEERTAWNAKANRSRVTFSKETVTIPATASYVAQTGTYTPGTDTPGATLVNLPNASTVPAGQRLIIADESGTIRPWFRLQITPNGTQKIDGENIYTNLYYPYSMITLVSNGLNGWMIENIKPVATAITSPLGKRSQYCYENELPLGAGNSQPGDIRIYTQSTTVAPNSDGTYATGSAQIPAGTASGHYGSIISGGAHTSRLRLGNTKNRWIEYNIKVDNLPDATNDAAIRIGYTDSTNTSTPPNGAFFNLSRATDSVNWVMRTTNNNSTTTTSTTVPFTSGTFQRFGVEINDDLTAAYFFINDVLVGTLTTNIPTTTRQVSAHVSAMWVVGTTARTITVDRIREHFIVIPTSLRPV